jgi:adenylate cyclase
MIDVDAIYHWLVEGAPGADGPASVVGRMNESLLAAGVPVERSGAFIRTLHPEIMGRAFRWNRGKPVEIAEAPMAVLSSPGFKLSPVAAVMETGQTLRRHLTNNPPAREETVVGNLAAEGFTDYVVIPIKFMSGEVHAITFATLAPGGFTDEHLAALHRVVIPLARLAEIMALRRIATNLLSTYVGHNAGERILAGKIQLGDTETIHAVIWFSDLRGFTALSGSIGPDALIHTLNEVFHCQVTAIQRHGGEVLKFIGDGLLAIFPTGGSADRTSVCNRALDAANDAFKALELLNLKRVERGDCTVRFGLALHIGDISYGNIGGAGRLDFTCIGTAVNLAARIEALTGQLKRDIIVSSTFAELTTRSMESIGSFTLKGVRNSEAVFVPTAAPTVYAQTPSA